MNAAADRIEELEKEVKGLRDALELLNLFDELRKAQNDLITFGAAAVNKKGEHVPLTEVFKKVTDND